VPAPIPAPAPSVSCHGITVSQSTISGNDACTSTKTQTSFFDTADLCTSTLYYGTDNTSYSVYTTAVYVTAGGNVRFWTGSAWGGSCTGCP